MHLTDADIDGYIARTLDRCERGRIDLHLDTCLRCTLRLDAAAAAPERWARRGRLRRLVPVIPSPRLPLTLPEAVRENARARIRSAA